jgi:serine protease Do
MVGESVITIGNAFGYENTVSVGIISALHRDVTLSDEQVYRNLIQTDACINPGNSGGPLINIDGELIGINVAVRAGAQGIGFALPIDEVKRVAAEMISTRRLASMWHGLVASDLRRGKKRAVVISEVQSGSPAELAGFKPGDEVVKVGDLGVDNALDIERGMLEIVPGHPAKITIRRAGTESSLGLDVKPVPANLAAAASSGTPPDDLVWRLLGLKTTPVSTDYVASVSSKLRGGLYVSAVSPGSPAAQAAIQKGDILVGMNVGSRHWETIRADNILYVLRQPETTQTQTALLYVIRKNGIQPRKISLITATGNPVITR